jgi:predicted Zn-dependent protease
MARRPLAYALALAGATTSLGALWPSQAQLAELRERAAATPDERVRALEDRLALAPGDRRLLVRLADGYARAGRAEAGLAVLEAEARRRELDREELATGRRLALAIGQPRRALALHLGPHARRRPGELKSLVDLAVMAGDPAAALKLQRELATARPGDLAAADRLRDLALMASDLKAAMEAQARILAAHPSPAAAERLASLCLQVGDARAALDALERARQAGPAWHYRAAQLAEWGGQPARAVPHLQALYDAAPQPEIGRRLAAALTRAGDPRALDCRLALATRFAGDARLVHEAADALAAAGRGPEALELLVKVVGARPGDVAAHDALVDFALGRGLLDGAVAELGRWVARRPKDMASLARLAEVLGWQGRAAEACAVYERLFATCRPPAALEGRWRRAWLALAGPEVDRSPAGRANLAALVALEPQQPELRRRLARARWAAGERDAAIADQRALEDPADRAVLAGWLVRAGRAREGLEVLEASKAALPPVVLADAAYEAARGGAWPEASLLFGRLAHHQPRDPHRWADLAASLEAQGDAGGAAEAWRQRLALGGARPADKLRYVRLLTRAAREREALAIFAAQPWQALDAQALAEGAALARSQGDRALEERALRAAIARRGTDVQARLRLIELLDRRGASAEADLQARACLGLATQDPAALLSLASRAHPSADVIERLAALPEPSAAACTVLANAFEAQAPARAAHALDRLHHLTGGTAASWLRRGDLAQRLGQPQEAHLAWSRALELAPTASETRAWTLDRLGRAEAALATWKALAKPGALAPNVAVARHYVDAGEPEAAGPFLTRALAIAPQDPAVRRLQADYLARAGRPADALAVTRTLPRDAGVLALEAQLHHDLGQFRQAAAAADAASQANPALAPLLRPLRQEVATRPRAVARFEHTAGADRQDLGLEGQLLLGENTQGSVAVHQDTFGEARVRTLDLGLSQPLGAARLEGHLGLAGQEPLGRAGVRWPHGGVSVGQERWAETPAAVAGNGQERAVRAEGNVQVLGLDLQADAGVGRLVLDGAEVGTSTSAHAQVAVHPGPVTLAYQYGHRGWGAAAPLVGLPASADSHGVVARYDAGWGPVRLSLAPGYALDAASGAGAPTFTGGLTWAPTANAEVSLTGAFAGRSFDQGLADAYRLFEVAASLAF